MLVLRLESRHSDFSSKASESWTTLAVRCILERNAIEEAASHNAEEKMRKRTRHHIAIVRRGVFRSILLILIVMFVFSSETRVGFGLAYADQDQAPPPSPSYAALTPDNLDFGDQVVRRTSAAKRITVRNTGGKPLYFESVDLGGDNPNSFAIFKDTCTGSTIGPDRACIVDVTFTPTGTGGRNARLKWTCDALNCPQRVRLKGHGINSSAVPPF